MVTQKESLKTRYKGASVKLPVQSMSRGAVTVCLICQPFPPGRPRFKLASPTLSDHHVTGHHKCHLACEPYTNMAMNHGCLVLNI